MKKPSFVSIISLTVALSLTGFIMAFLFVTFCEAKEVYKIDIKGLALGSNKEYQTSLGKLKHGYILLNQPLKNSIDASGKMHLLFGIIYIDTEHAIQISDKNQNDIQICQGVAVEKNQKITFIQDQTSGIWVATDGIMCVQNNSHYLLNNTIVNVVGGTENPIKILGQPFADTKILIENDEPSIVKWWHFWK